MTSSPNRRTHRDSFLVASSWRVEMLDPSWCLSGLGPKWPTNSNLPRVLDVKPRISKKKRKCNEVTFQSVTRSPFIWTIHVCNSKRSTNHTSNKMYDKLSGGSWMVLRYNISLSLSYQNRRVIIWNHTGTALRQFLVWKDPIMDSWANPEYKHNSFGSHFGAFYLPFVSLKKFNMVVSSTQEVLLEPRLLGQTFLGVFTWSQPSVRSMGCKGLSCSNSKVWAPARKNCRAKCPCYRSGGSNN